MIRLIVTSDTHYHPQWRQPLVDMVGQIASLKPDCLIVAGDVAEGIDNFHEMLKLLDVLPCPRLIIAGNHDVWINNGLDSLTLWQEALPQATSQHGAIWLENSNWISGSLGVCGTMSWYDYTGCNPNIGIPMEAYADLKKTISNDARYINWPFTDQVFATQLEEGFAKRLDTLEANPLIKHIVAITHVPVFPETIVKKQNDRVWEMGQAYFYNFTLGKRMAASRKISHVVSGHIHWKFDLQVAGVNGPIAVKVLGAHYGKPAFMVLDLPND
jgi:predicted phosphohydrolase